MGAPLDRPSHALENFADLFLSDCGMSLPRTALLPARKSPSVRERLTSWKLLTDSFKPFGLESTAGVSFSLGRTSTQRARIALG